MNWWEKKQQQTLIRHEELTEVAAAKSGIFLFNKTFSSFVNNLRRAIHPSIKIIKKAVTLQQAVK